MQIPSSMMTHVRTFDVEALRAQQQPVSDRIGTIEIAPKQTQTNVARTEKLFDELQETLSKYSGAAQRLGAARQLAMNEARYSDENGFTRQVNQRSKALYATAKSGGLVPYSFNSKQDAMNYASGTLDLLQSLSGVINRDGGGDPDLGGKFISKFSPDDQAQWHELKSLNDQAKDGLEAARMRLFVEAEMLSLSLEVNGPIYEVLDGQVRIGTFDIEFSGESILRSTGDGRTAEYRSDGSLKFDTYA